ncbi:DUF4295 family protein [Blattabacterium cuenoti]|uniref:DUF4295 family protein n=1 Tax=Blattabacterium cuenoti TaxID=1653831 RepID=UPI00163BE348|nr:DUF4295 family protein [Blattabacterium cuenoti]
MSKKIVKNKKKENLKKIILAIRTVKSKKSGSYTFEKKFLPYNEVKNFFQKNDIY